MKKIIPALLAAIILASPSAFAWGKFGHQIIVAVAQRHLTEKAKANIAAVMPYDMKKDAGWMDAHRKDSLLRHTHYYHTYTATAEGKYDPNSTIRKGDSMRALLLTDYNLTHQEQLSDSLKLLSLRMLIHFAGDYHCPVHVHFKGVKMAGDWFLGEKSYGNFHHLYDAMPSVLFKGMSADQVAAMLDEGVTAKQVKYWQSGSFIDWFNRSSELNKVVYAINPPTTEKGNHQLNPETFTQSEPIIKEQLLAAGYQLALLLNKYYGE